MKFEERPCAFACAGDSLLGIVAVPDEPANRGVVIVVGGPQYRVGSHRQFTLLARALAAEGVPSLRFDYRGMGDSEGESRTFLDVDEDIRAAVDVLIAQCPSVTEVVLWGLCDAASAALLYAPGDPRVRGLVLLNPWVRSEATFARAQVKHYYAERILQPELWQKVANGDFAWRESLSSLAKTVKSLGRRERSEGDGTPFQARMAHALRAFQGATLLVIAGDDLTAKEFLEHAQTDPAWQGVLGGSRISRVDFPACNHTFSDRASRRSVEDATLHWLRSW
jgi:exosortase A-associated hydrolase 1